MPYLMDSQPQSPSTSETSENSTYTSKKRKRTPWTSMEGQILIEVCKEHKISLKGNGSSQKWEGITHELNMQVERRSKQLVLDQDGNAVQR